MAGTSEKLVSPGVFTQENDLSYLPQGIAQIGAAIIGPTVKGPAFIPTLVESYTDFTDKFGYPDGKSYVPYTVRNYMKHSGRATIVRVAGYEGYTADLLQINFTPATGSYSGSVLMGALIAHGNDTGSSADFSNWTINFGLSSSADPTLFGLNSASVSYTCSLNPNSDSYVAYMLGTAPGTGRNLYVYATANSEELQAMIEDETIAWGEDSGSLTTASLNNAVTLTGTYAAPAYTTPSTPYITSQLGNELFKFHHFNAGASDVYVSIDNIKFSGEIGGTTYGSFNVLVRLVGDTDLRPQILETFAGCNMNPDSPDYIARKIGDQYRQVVDDANGNPKVQVNGDFVNKSKYIRVEMANAYAETEVPFGFANYYLPVEGSNPGFDLEHRYVQKDNVYDTGSNATSSFQFKYYYGFDMSDTDNLFVLKPISNTATTFSSSFSLANVQIQSGSSTSVATQIWTASLAPSKSRKFSVALQGGFDGFNPVTAKYVGNDISATNVMGLDCSTPTSTGTLAYRKAIDTVANPDEFDINMLVLPGILNVYHGSVVSYAYDMAEQRGDTFFFFDPVGLDDSVADAIDSVAGLDTNYAATYYPWVKIYDNDNTKYIWVPPTVVIAAVMAFNDKVGAPWYAPAGLNRGGIPEATQVYTRLTQSERDDLYDGRVNPIVTFINQGIVTWGQKTLQVKASALDRINVRRLLIELKKYIASATKYLVFEQNTVQTRTRFINIVTPYLDSVQQKQGLYTFKVVMDETNNTPDVIDRNMMVGTIWLQPTKTAEIIKIDFNITPTGATFGA